MEDEYKVGENYRIFFLFYRLFVPSWKYEKNDLGYFMRCKVDFKFMGPFRVGDTVKTNAENQQVLENDILQQISKCSVMCFFKFCEDVYCPRPKIFHRHQINAMSSSLARYQQRTNLWFITEIDRWGWKSEWKRSWSLVCYVFVASQRYTSFANKVQIDTLDNMNMINWKEE